ncbi:hypothetical protein RRG08_006358 [Elysia crispata]|uniref:Uncharacterized protein n=1 Tax=Elysia crispata TaxID=231223 RepID=A0AAE0Z9H2_9GAST|nr:hypothetical protein RRG08_006358 [Elysia crispata]
MFIGVVAESPRGSTSVPAEISHLSLELRPRPGLETVFGPGLILEYWCQWINVGFFVQSLLRLSLHEPLTPPCCGKEPDWLKSRVGQAPMSTSRQFAIKSFVILNYGLVTFWDYYVMGPFKK